MNKSIEPKKVGNEINLKDGFKILPKPRRKSSVGDIIQEMKYRLKLSPQTLQSMACERDKVMSKNGEWMIGTTSSSQQKREYNSP